MSKNKLSVKAINKNVRSSSRKIALVLDYIRGKKAYQTPYCEQKKSE